MIALVYKSEAQEPKFELMKRLIKEFSEGKITYRELWARLDQDSVNSYPYRSRDEYSDRVSAM